MTAIRILTEATIRSLTTPESFSRGEEYYHSGAVSDIERRGDVLHAEVEGSSYQPYQVTIELDESGIIAADCSCPYDWGGYCKHIVAVLLTYVHGREEIAERPTPDALLADLDAEMLRGLLSGLLTAHAGLIPWVETQIALAGERSQPAAPSPSQAAAKPRRSPVDTSAIRRQVRYQMRGSDDYYAGAVVGGLDLVLMQAEEALDADDGENALAIAEVIVDEIIPGWEEYDDSDGEFADFFRRLGAVMTEAVLTAEPSPAERQAWARKLEKWQAELDDYGVDQVFDAAIAAAEQGWEYGPLRRVMAGHISEEGAWDGEAPRFADNLTAARLNVLERQGRIQEYLNLAEAEGQSERYVTMLVKAGRTQEAVDHGLKYLGDAGEALALAKALRERGDTRAALRIGERGLGLGGNDLNPLASWLRDAAAAAGDDTLAVRAARAAFETSLSLADYQALQAVAGDGWPILRPELLRQLNEATTAWGAVDVYLYEGLIDDAIQRIDARSYTGYAEVEKVVDAVWQSHPDWAICQCRKQAEPIMDEAKSKYYHHALRWLGKAREAYVSAGRADEWRAYCEGLIAKHGRKHSLVPGLRELLRGTGKQA